MNKIFLFFTLISFFSVAANTASAQTSRVYFAGYLGLNSSTSHEFSESSRPASGDISLKNAPVLAGALGLRFTPALRFEAEISRRKTEMDRMDINGGGSYKLGGDLTSWLYMINGYYDIDLGWRKLMPFATAGIGFAVHDAEIIDGANVAANGLDTSWGLALQLGSGLKYRVKDNMAFTGSYRFIGTTDMEVDSYDIGYSSHEIRLGIEYDLPVSRILKY